MMTERWKPEVREPYWITGFDQFIKSVWTDDNIDEIRWESGNCFKTREEVEAATEKVKELLLSLHDTTKPTATTANTQVKKLPDWCTVGEWCYCLDDDGNGKYFKITEIKDNFIYGDDWDIDYHFISQARLRPYNEVEMKALVGKVISKGPSIHFVTGFENVFDDESMVHVNGCLYNAKDLLRNGFTYDTHHCGVFEHRNEKGDWVQ